MYVYVCIEVLGVNLHHPRNHLFIFLAPGDAVEPAGEIDNLGAFFGGSHYGEMRNSLDKNSECKGVREGWSSQLYTP